MNINPVNSTSFGMAVKIDSDLATKIASDCDQKTTSALRKAFENIHKMTDRNKNDVLIKLDGTNVVSEFTDKNTREIRQLEDMKPEFSAFAKGIKKIKDAIVGHSKSENSRLNDVDKINKYKS